jgi:hypothetical protein
MARETMTKSERIGAALTLKEKPDRVPFAPFFAGCAATFQGLTQAEYFSDAEIEIDTIAKTFDDFGGWDGLCPAPMVSSRILHWFALRFPVRLKLPGIDLPKDYNIQTHEAEHIKYEDYDRILQEGYSKFYFDDLLFRLSDLRKEDVPAQLEKFLKCVTKGEEVWSKRDVVMMYGSAAAHPFFSLSLGRSMIPFTEDLYYRPDIVEKVLQQMTDEIIAETITNIKNSGTKHFFLVEERASAYQYPLHIFERFWMPFTERIVDAMWSQGIITTFHIDTDWGNNLPYFKRLPKGSFCLQLDSTTDIFAAKQLLRGHCCLHGDVPATLLSIGAMQDVEDYCNKLVREVGDDGGFILGTGCECPIDCKRENFKTMLEVSRKSFA